MTVEHRVIVGLGDIRAVVLECKKCGARLRLSPEKVTDGHLGRCPSCREDWLSLVMRSGDAWQSRSVAFLLSLSAARESQADALVNLRILFEIDDPVSLAKTAQG
ncbi:MAG TPA: hypothetical protein VMH39_12030 [Gemmatimonadaceae bacterium]|nr:hypothetical protein [Gemmatimonadaceae bacterium]